MTRKPKHKILIIEDNKILNELYTLKFQKEDFVVISSFNGEDGLAKIKKRKTKSRFT